MKFTKVSALNLFLLVFMLSGSIAEDSFRFAFTLDPFMSIPTGPSDVEGKNIYTPGGGGRIAFTLFPVPLSFFGAEIELGEDVQITRLAQKPLSLTRVGFGVVLTQSIGVIELRAQGHGGWYYGLYNGTGAGNVYYDGSLSALFKISAPIRVGLTGGWRDYAGSSAGFTSSLSQGPYAGLSFVLYPAEFKNTSNVKIKNTTIDRIFPTLLKYYDKNPIGWVDIQNGEQEDIRNVSVSIFISEFMDEPKESEVIASIRKGGSERVSIFALLNDKTLGITEGMVKSARVVVSYTILNQQRKVETVYSISILDRNSLTWEDTRKAAAFITAKDPIVLSYAKQAASVARETANTAGDVNLRMAITLFEALASSGIKYVTDPKSAYENIDVGSSSVDFMQFPSQTLTYRSGDCDDLTILYCALLESIGVETAMLTTPGHIMPAFALKLSPEDAASFITDQNSYFIFNDRIWLPVEITSLSRGFYQAWREGAREISEAAKLSSAEVYTTHDSWTVYEPIGFSLNSMNVAFPQVSVLEKALIRESDKIVASELPEREKELVGAISKAPANQKGRLYNRLGILYARFGKYADSEKQFKQAIQAGNGASLINIANVYMLQKRYQEAYAQYKAVLKNTPSNITALTGLAMCADVLGLLSEAKSARELIDKLKADAANTESTAAAAR